MTKLLSLWQADWIINLLTSWLNDQSFDKLTEWQIPNMLTEWQISVTGWLNDKSLWQADKDKPDKLTEWPTLWQADWISNHLTGSLNDQPSDRLTEYQPFDRLTEWQTFVTISLTMIYYLSIFCILLQFCQKSFTFLH